MKKALALLLCLLLLAGVFAGCAKSGTSDTAGNETAEGNGVPEGGDAAEPETEPATEPATEAPTEPPAPPTLADDTNVMGMRFTAPEAYATVERLINRSPDGTLNETDVTYYFDDETSISYAYIHGYGLDVIVDVETADSVTCDGKPFYLMRQSGTVYAFAAASDGLYAVSVELTEGEDETCFDRAMESICFGGEESVPDAAVLEDIQWTIPAEWTLAATLSTREEKPDGTLVSDRCTFSFGEDLLDPEWRFTIAAYRGERLEDRLASEKTYDEQEINGVVYQVYAPYGDPYDYYTQQGDDVWRISNAGVSNGLFYDRSDESVEAFASFIASIRFE